MTSAPTRHEILIVGGGLCGLSAAYHLEQRGHTDYLLLERNPEVGGLARTETFSGFSFDHSIHILYTSDPYATHLICDVLLAGNLRKQDRESFCYTAGLYTAYPYQANTYGLPAEIILENVIGLIEARYEQATQPPPANFEEWVYRTFGCGIAEHFMVPYNRRVWAWDLKDMSYEWIAERVPMPEIREVLLGALKPPEKRYGPNREFWYPLEGGVEALSQAFLRHIPPGRIRLNTAVAAIEPSKRQIVCADGTRLGYDWLISTLALPVLFKAIPEVPEDIRQHVAGLKHNLVHTVNLGLEGSEMGVSRRMHWVYFPEEQTIFHRISFPHRFSSWMVPPGCVSIQAEISESVMRPRNRATLVQETLEGLIRVGLLTEREARPVAHGGRVRVSEVITLNPAYIIYDHYRRQHVQRIRDYLLSLNIETRGRFGEWRYSNMDHAILSGKAAVERVVGSQVSAGGSGDG